MARPRKNLHAFLEKTMFGREPGAFCPLHGLCKCGLSGEGPGSVPERYDWTQGSFADLRVLSGTLADKLFFFANLFYLDKAQWLQVGDTFPNPCSMLRTWVFGGGGVTSTQEMIKEKLQESGDEVVITQIRLEGRPRGWFFCQSPTLVPVPKRQVPKYGAHFLQIKNNLPRLWCFFGEAANMMCELWRHVWVTISTPTWGLPVNGHRSLRKCAMAWLHLWCSDWTSRISVKVVQGWSKLTPKLESSSNSQETMGVLF